MEVKVSFDDGLLAKVTFDNVVVKDNRNIKNVKLIMLKGERGAGGASEWGEIEGTLANQTDLQNALDAKADTADIPTKTSDLTNDSGFITIAVVPTKTSDLTNDSGFITSAALPTKTSDLTNDSNFVSDANYVHTDNNFTTTEKDKLSGIAAGAEVNVNADWNASSGDAEILNKPSIPTKTSDLTNDSNFVSDANYVHTDNNFTTAEKNKLSGVASGAEENVIDSVAVAGTALVPTNKQVNVPAMTGATASAAGAAGVVPAPSAGDEDKFLRADGTWQASGGGITFDDVYPVGSIYMSVNSANPSTLFGGTWQRIQDTFLLAAGSTYSPGDTGGSASHSIDKANLPSGVTGSVNFRGYNGTGNLITSASGVFSSAGHDASSTMPTTSAGSSNKHYTQLSFNLGGSGTPLDTMPPYLAVYCWQRTA